jgi:hypothetical protein
MRIELISTAELGPAELLDWRRLQARERSTATPALSPHWARCVGEVRADARVAVLLDDAGRTLGFLPVEIGRTGMIEPLAASLDLGCGLVGDPLLEWGAAEWLRDVRAPAFVFSGAPEEQMELARAARGAVVRLSVELGRGVRGRRLTPRVAADRPPRIRLFSCHGADFDRTLRLRAGAFRRPHADWEIGALRSAFERDEEDGFYGALFTSSRESELTAGLLFLVERRAAQLVTYGEDPGGGRHESAAALMPAALAALAERGVAEVDLGADSPPVRDFATRRRCRLYGRIRPAARRLRAIPLARSAGRAWSALASAARRLDHAPAQLRRLSLIAADRPPTVLREPQRERPLDA